MEKETHLRNKTLSHTKMGSHSIRQSSSVGMEGEDPAMELGHVSMVDPSSNDNDPPK